MIAANLYTLAAASFFRIKDQGAYSRWLLVVTSNEELNRLHDMATDLHGVIWCYMENQ